MAQTEILEMRSTRSKTFQDTLDPKKRSLWATMAALHYESVLGSGNADTEIDATPSKVVNAAFDGWRVTANTFHYALGKDLANHGDQDGWVGFGGRQGSHWFKFRLARLGYLHWPTRAWSDLGGAPTYSRSNLSLETEAVVLGSTVLNATSKATWADIWNTPGGGALDISWRIDGDRLHEKVTINEEARDWIEANAAPTTPANETFFGFVFQVDWSDIPKAYLGQVLQNIDDEIDDDLDEISLKDADDELLAFLPWSFAYVGDGTPNGREQKTLRKRFWKDGDGNHYMLLGVRVDQYAQLPAGDIVFDPDVNPQIAADTDDGVVSGNPCVSWLPSNGFNMAGDWSGSDRSAWMRFTGLTIVGTVTTAYLDCYLSQQGTDAYTRVYAIAVDQPGAPGNCSEWDDDYDFNLSTAFGYWDGPWSSGWNQSETIVDVIQEIVDADYLIASDPILFYHLNDGSDPSAYLGAVDYSGTPANAAKLYVEWSLPEVNFSATVSAVSTTPAADMLKDIAQAATLTAVSTTPDTVTLDVDTGFVNFTATLAAVATTPSIDMLKDIELGAAVLASVSTTPDDVVLNPGIPATYQPDILRVMQPHGRPRIPTHQLQL